MVGQQVPSLHYCSVATTVLSVQGSLYQLRATRAAPQPVSGAWLYREDYKRIQVEVVAGEQGTQGEQSRANITTRQVVGGEKREEDIATVTTVVWVITALVLILLMLVAGLIIGYIKKESSKNAVVHFTEET